MLPHQPRRVQVNSVIVNTSIRSDVATSSIGHQRWQWERSEPVGIDGDFDRRRISRHPIDCVRCSSGERVCCVLLARVRSGHGLRVVRVGEASLPRPPRRKRRMDLSLSSTQALQFGSRTLGKKPSEVGKGFRFWKPVLRLIPMLLPHRPRHSGNCCHILCHFASTLPLLLLPLPLHPIVFRHCCHPASSDSKSLLRQKRTFCRHSSWPLWVRRGCGGGGRCGLRFGAQVLRVGVRSCFFFWGGREGGSFFFVCVLLFTFFGGREASTTSA